jgi:hypothetical protein
VIGDLIARLQTLQSRVSRGQAMNVNDRQTKEEIISTATTYFSSIRHSLVEGLGDESKILPLDAKWQDLIRLAHGNNSRKSYQKLIRAIQKELTALNVVRLSSISHKGFGGSGVSDMTPAEQMVVTTLDNSVPSAAASYRQAILDLAGGERLSYRGTASELREALRETIDHLAPDGDVMGQTGFKSEQCQNKPTMKQKVRFILRSRGTSKTQREVAENSLDLVESLTGEVARSIYNRASLATHVETTRNEVLKIKRYVDTVLHDLLEISE